MESPTDMQQQRISYMNLGVGNPFKVCYDVIFDITYVVLPQKVKFEVMKSWSFDVMFGEEFLLTYQTHCREKKACSDSTRVPCVLPERDICKLFIINLAVI